jgi:hypothetical protein
VSCCGIPLLGGINRIDSNLTAYPVAKKEGKKYLHLFNKMIWNSCVLSSENGGVKNHMLFWIELVELLIQEDHSEDGNLKPGCPGIEPNPFQVDRTTFSLGSFHHLTARKNLQGRGKYVGPKELLRETV